MPGATIIAEYLDETRGDALDSHRLLPADVGGRVEVRRLLSWFNDKFFAEVSGPLVAGTDIKRLHDCGAGRRVAGAGRDPCGTLQYPLSSGLYRLAGRAPAIGLPATA